MNNNRETSSNSIKFAPMPVSALLANLIPLQQEIHSSDSSFVSDESDDSVEEHRKQKSLLPKKVNKSSTPKHQNTKDVKKFASEKKIYSDHNKENIENVKVTNQTFPSNDFNLFLSAQKSMKTLSAHPNSERKDNLLVPKNHQSSLNANIKTPEIKVSNSSQKTKTATPKIKSGIRRFTPGSNRQSLKKIQPLIPNRDKVRCELFRQNPPAKSNQLQTPDPPPMQAPIPVRMAMPEPETPLNKKPMPASYAATPSYPQGVVSNNSKILFKTTSIKDKKYMYIKKLGTGGSSEVFKVLEVGSSAEYAVKCVHLATDQELAQGYINEVRLLRELQNSDRVIRLYDYEYDRVNQFLRLVLEVGETDLSSFLRARGAGLPPALVLHYWEEMLQAVLYIHDRGVIHADLKPANFLLVCGRLKLIDFGIASAISSDATSVVRSQAAGTYSYISPEALMGGAGGHAPIKISFRSDVWSLGCILYSMIYGKTPFGHIPNLAKLTAILDPNHQIDYPPADHLPPSLLSSLRWCLTYVARFRPTVRELLGIRHLQPPQAQTHQKLPPSLLTKIRPHITDEEYGLLQKHAFLSLENSST